MVHMASSWRSRESDMKDGRFNGVSCGAVKVRSTYPLLVVVFLLAHKCILVFWFSLYIEPHGCYGRYPSPTHLSLGLHFARCGVCFMS
jgi:hypothetical protein